MKKLFVWLSVGMLVFGMTGCGNADNGAGNQSSEQQSSQQQSSEPQESSQQSSEQQNAQSSENGQDMQQSETIVNGYDYANGWTEDMSAVRKAVVDDLGENYWPDMPVMPDMMELFFGITTDMYDDYFAETPMISGNVDTLIVVQAKEDRVEDVVEALNAYRDTNVNDTLQYPMNVGKVQASVIERIGNYVCFVQLGADTQEASESGDEAVIAQCQEVNERVIKILNQQLQQ